jgi:hypothetical protein
MGTWENHPKSNKITLKAPKKPYNIPCFETPQNGFLLLEKALAHAKNSPVGVATGNNIKQIKALVFKFPKWLFYFWIRIIIGKSWIQNIYRIDKNKCKTFPVFIPTTIRSILTASPLSRQLIPFIGMCLSKRIIGTTINPEFVFDS